MSIAHLHLLLNHVPVVGIVGLIALLAIAITRRSSELSKVSLGFTVALALVAVAVYFTGEPAEELIERLPGFDEALVERHEEAAEAATVAFAALGALAGGLLVIYRKRALPRRAAAIGLIGCVAVGGLLAWTANLGGQIRHPEIRAASVASGAARRGAEPSPAERGGRDMLRR